MMAALKIVPGVLPDQLVAIAPMNATMTHQKIQVRRRERSAIAARRRAGSAAISSKRMSDLVNIILCGVKWPNDQKLSHAAGDSRQPETRSEN